MRRRPDGLTIGTFNTGLIYNQLIKADGVKFDLTKMSWIGKAASEPRVFVIGAQSPIKTFEDLQTQKQPVNFATSGIGSANYVEINALTQRAEAAGQGPDRLQRQRRPARHAARRNRRRHGLALVVRAVREERLWPLHRPDRRHRKGRSAAARISIKDPNGRTIVALIQSQGDIARLTAGPPGIPATASQALRDAYARRWRIQELQAKAEKLERPVDPAYGDDVLKAIQGSAQPEAGDGRAAEERAREEGQPAATPAAATPALRARSPNGTAAPKLMLKLDDGKTFEAEISGSRTEITVAGQKADRDALKVGMTCTVDAPSGGGEAKKVACN